jgi:hypothetical protein
VIILHRLYSFKIQDDDMVNIYIQKVACRVILQDRYISFGEALEILNLEMLRQGCKKIGTMGPQVLRKV